MLFPWLPSVKAVILVRVQMDVNLIMNPIPMKEEKKSEVTLVDLLQSLADMDITFQALKETDIGRHVNKLGKHSSNDVRRLVKHLVRKWKDTVDEWVSVNQRGEHEPAALMDGDSPQQKPPQNGRQQIPDFAYSPNPHNGGSGSEKNNSEPERKPKPIPPRKDPPSRPTHLTPPQNVQRQREQKETNFDAERLASARKRLQESYKEAENDMHQIRVLAVLAGDFLLSRACVVLAALKNTEVESLVATVVENLVMGETMQMTTSSEQRCSMDYYMQKTY